MHLQGHLLTDLNLIEHLQFQLSQLIFGVWVMLWLCKTNVLFLICWSYFLSLLTSSYKGQVSNHLYLTQYRDNFIFHSRILVSPCHRHFLWFIWFIFYILCNIWVCTYSTAIFSRLNQANICRIRKHNKVSTLVGNCFWTL